MGYKTDIVKILSFHKNNSNYQFCPMDKNNHQNVKILSYAIKYASSYYGPFRDAVGTKNLYKNEYV